MKFGRIIWMLIVGLSLVACQKDELANVNAGENHFAQFDHYEFPPAQHKLPLNDAQFEPFATNPIPLTRVIGETFSNSIDFNVDGNSDLSVMLVSDLDENGNSSEALRFLFNQPGWQVAYKVFEEKTYFCDRNESFQKGVIYSTNQQDISCQTEPYAEFNKKVYSKLFTSAEDLNEINWISNAVFLSKTVNINSENQGVGQFYYSGFTFGNSGIILFKSPTNQMFYVEVSVPTYYEVGPDEIKRYHIKETKLASFGRYHG